MRRTRLFCTVLAIVMIYCPVMISAQDKRDSMPDSVAGGLLSIMEVLVADSNFTVLAEAIDAAGLSEMLEEDGLFTLFAPNDSAFAKLPSQVLEKLLKDKKRLKELLACHLVPNELLVTDMVEAKTAVTLNDETIIITEKDKQVMVNGALVIAKDIRCFNGVIQIINTVLLPSPGD